MPERLLPPPPTAIHFLGIGGIAMSGLARALLERGYTVGGCDLTPNRLTDELAARGATMSYVHDPAHLDGVDLLVISAAVKPQNPELAAAIAHGVPVVKAAGLLSILLDGMPTIAVAGTHGKTTTSALVATILLDAGLDPTAFIGGEVAALGGNVHVGQGPWAVAEADEYDERFLSLAPRVAVVTNVEADHFDYYGDVAGVASAFARFIALLPADGALIACADDPLTMRLAEEAPCRVITYGLEHPAQWTARDICLDEGGARFIVSLPEGDTLPVATRLSGRHNVANTLAALAASAGAGVRPGDALQTLARFVPPRRRQEVKGVTAGGALVLDDYAHHPTEIRATLAGLRARYPGRRLRVAFQPHTYSRTRALLAEIAGSFDDADEVAVTEVYAARETDTLGVSGRDVAAAAADLGMPVTFVPTVDDAARWLGRDAGPDVAVVTMGAGDIWKAGEQVREA